MDGCAFWHDPLGMWSGSVAIRFRVDGPQSHFMRDACLKAHACQIARVPNSRNQNPNLVPGTAPRAARCGMPIVPCFRLLPSPVLTTCFQQLRTRRYVAVFPALALPNVDDHAFAVDVLDPETVRRRPHRGGADLMDKAYPMERTGQRPVCSKLRLSEKRSWASFRPTSIFVLLSPTHRRTLAGLALSTSLWQWSGNFFWRRSNCRSMLAVLACDRAQALV